MKAFLLLGLAITSNLVFGSDEFSCEMNLGSGKIVRVHFDSSVPSLTETTFSNDNDADGLKRLDTTETLLSPTQVCGIPTDFAKSCQKSEIHEGKDFNYSFRCDEAFGDLFFLNNDGYSEFRCMGDAVNPKYGERVYRNCELAKK